MPSHLHTLTLPQPHTLTPSSPHTLIPSHPHTLTRSHPLTPTPSCPHTLTSSHSSPYPLLLCIRVMSRKQPRRFLKITHPFLLPRTVLSLWLMLVPLHPPSLPPSLLQTLPLSLALGLQVDAFLDHLAAVTKEEEQKAEFLKIIQRWVEVKGHYCSPCLCFSLPCSCTSIDLKFVVRLIKHDLRINAGPKHMSAYSTHHLPPRPTTSQPHPLFLTA